MEVLKVLAQDRVSTASSSSSFSRSPTEVLNTEDEKFEGFFRTFPRLPKKCELIIRAVASAPVGDITTRGWTTTTTTRGCCWKCARPVLAEPCHAAHAMAPAMAALAVAGASHPVHRQWVCQFVTWWFGLLVRSSARPWKHSTYFPREVGLQHFSTSPRCLAVLQSTGALGRTWHLSCCSP